jgi:PAS domain S-box-containing protein
MSQPTDISPSSAVSNRAQLAQGLAELSAQFAVFQPHERLNSALASQVLALAEAALQQGLMDVHQTARSLASFLDGLLEQGMDTRDQRQIQRLLDNLHSELHGADPARARLEPTGRLVPAIAPSQSSGNDRVGLYIESRAVCAMLEAALSQAGFLPSPLASMQALDQLSEKNAPAAIVADLSLCLRDSAFQASFAALRQRCSTPPHLFALASNDDVAARLQAVRLGATRFLKKPVDREQLIAILKGVTARTPTAPFRVLFVDDDRSMTTLYCAALEKIGLQARGINDPLAAPALVAEFAPDVIVTDVYMPGCNGLELAALLRQDEALADTPILFLSSETDIQRQMEALDLGADDFLTKPVNLAVLQAAVVARAKRSRMLKRSRHEYQRVAEHLQRIEMAINRHSIVSISDLDGTILYVNPRFCAVSGYAQNELLGANQRILKSGLHSPEFYQDLWQTLASGRSWHGELCNRRKDGSHFWVESTITPQLDDKGTPQSYVAVLTDITPLKDIQAQLMVAKAEAEAASQAKTVFLAHMSHELKTPLNSILGFSQVMLGESSQPPTPDQTEMLSAIERAGRHLLALISDLVDLAKIETGHLGLEMADMALAPLLRECLALLKPQAQKRGIRLNFTEPAEPARVLADRIRVKQVLLNLLSNAVKYNIDQGEVSASLSRHASCWHLSLRDTGPGIALADQASLFQPFSRLRSTAKQVEGAGIGLSLSKSLIERMGGRIGVISQPGEGSEFWFDLPAIEQDAMP